jgi:cell division protein FtsI (penicillin-binding protein 3)
VSVVVRHVAKETPAEEADKLRVLRGLLGLSEREVSYLRARLEDKSPFTYVKKKIKEDEAAPVRALKLPGVEFEPATRRHYPLGSLASHVIGGLSLTEDSKNGIELRYDELLRGREGEMAVLQDRSGRGYQTQVIKPPVPGRNLMLTIDATIQYCVEKELARAVAEHGAIGGAAIVMEPRSGEILAMASFPGFDVNAYPGPQEAWLNRPVMASYEPGSTFKIITAAAARERDRVGFGEVFDCSAGFIRVGGTTITDHEREGVLSFPRVLIKSSNVGTVLFAQRLTVPEYYETARAFGIGSRTGIELPGEVAGRLRPPSEWKKSSLAHIAIGYEVMVSPLQMLRAMNVFATGGLLVRLRIVREDPAAAGAGAGDAPVRVIGEKTAADLVGRVFEGVVEEGTAKDGRLEGFRIAGKTGTAKKYDPLINAYSRQYMASFVGFVPVGQPRLTMIVVLDQPKEGYYGGQICAPVFRDIARKLLRYLRVPPERPLSSGVLTAGLEKGRGG